MDISMFDKKMLLVAQMNISDARYGIAYHDHCTFIYCDMSHMTSDDYNAQLSSKIAQNQ